MKKRKFNPMSNSMTVENYAFLAEKVAWIVCMCLTSMGYYAIVARYADSQAWHPFVKAVAGLCAAIAGAFITDVAFRRLLIEGVYQPLAWAHPNSPSLWSSTYFSTIKVVRLITIWAVVVAAVVMDFFSLKFTAQPIETAPIISYKAVTNYPNDDGTAKIGGYISLLKEEIRQTEAAVEAANPRLVQLARQGNTWAAKRLAREKQKATKATKGELEKAQRLHTEALQASINSKNEAAALHAKKISSSEQTARNLATMYFYGGLFAKGLIVLLNVFLVLSFLERTPNLDVNRDGSVDHRDVREAARPQFGVNF